MTSDFLPGRPAFFDNPHSDRVRKVAGLAGRSARSRHGLMLVEGPQAVRELVTHRSSHVHDVYFTRTAAQVHPDIVAQAIQATRWVHGISDDVGRAMSTDAQGIIAVAYSEAITHEAPVSVPQGSSMVMFAQGRDPGNVGTMIRTADAMGAALIITVTGTVDVRNPKVIRSSVGSVFHLPIVPVESFEAGVALCRSWDTAVLGTSGGYGTLALDALLGDSHSVLAQSHAWVFGHEAQGLSQAELDACDVLVNIPMSGRAESLNVASAAAMCLFASQYVRSAQI